MWGHWEPSIGCDSCDRTLQDGYMGEMGQGGALARRSEPVTDIAQ